MSFYSVWPAFAGIAILLGIVRFPPFDRIGVPSKVLDRVDTLDGIRGFLALAVFLHHSAIYHRYLADGVWTSPSSHFYETLGDMGVAIFFMITGYLFWRRLLEEGGRLNWLLLYNGRVFRIAPVYLFAIGLTLVVVMTKSGWQLNESLGGFLKNCLRWADLGSGLGGTPDIDRLPQTWIVMAGLTWTLHYEWLFYASLPLTSFVARSRAHLPLVAVGFCVSAVYAGFFPPPVVGFAPAIYVLLFLAGMLTASLQASGVTLPSRPAWADSGLVVVLLAAVFLIPAETIAVGPVLILATAFFLIASGADVFGLLRLEVSRRLGDISYGIYLLQGPVMFSILTFGPVRRFVLATPAAHWLTVLVCAVALVCLATMAHVLVEKPGIRAGRAVGRWIRQARRDYSSPGASSPAPR